MRIPKKLLIGVASLLVATGALVGILSFTGLDTSAMTITDRRDCGYTDTIVDCGTTSTAQLLDVYDKNDDRRGNRDIQAIFSHYDITRADIAGTQVKKGWLDTNGNISVDGKIVASNAKSLYRGHPGAGKSVSPVTIAGKTFYIGPVAGNYGLGADVFVYYRNGIFHAAIQASCGNPIIATNKVVPPTPPKAVYKCESLTATAVNRTTYDFTVKASATNAKIVSYNYDFGNGKKATTANTTVRHDFGGTAKSYTVTVTVNVEVDGKIVVSPVGGCTTTVTVKEEPKVPVYKCESLTAKAVNRTTYDFTVKASATNATIVSYNYDFGNGKKATTANTTVRHDYGNNPKTYTATVTVNVLVDGKTVVTPVGNCKATAKVVEMPFYTCDNLTSTKISRTEFKFTAAASVKNDASIVSYNYDFGDGKKSTTTSTAVNHTYANPGTYKATLSVNFKVEGSARTATGPSCQTTIVVDEKPAPSISIEKTVNGKEHVKVGVNTEFTYEITVRNTGNAVLKDAVVTDNAPSQVTLVSAEVGTIDGNKWTYTIPELKVGESKKFVIKAKYAKYAEGTHKNTVCVDTPTVPGSPDDCDDATTETDEPIEVCDLTDNTVKTIKKSEFDESTMTTDLTKCEDIEVCIIETKTVKTIKRNEFDATTMTTDLNECAEELPPELPLTGIESFISGGLGLGSITAAGYYWTSSRRNLLDALLKK